MSDNRQRSRSGEKLSSPDEAIPRATASAGPTRSGWRVSLPVAAAALAVSCIAIYISKQAPLKDGPYALCSREGKNIYTVDQENSRVQCIVVDGAYVVDSGSLHEVTVRWHDTAARAATPSTHAKLPVRFIPPGGIVIPGFTDAHAHILEYGAAQELALEGSKTIQDAVALVRSFILANPVVQNDSSKFVTGGGWDHTVWAGKWPTAADLDSDPIIRGRPVVLQSKDCHALWVSSKALELMGDLPPEVDGGIIVRDSAGNPTGLMLDNAQELVKQPPLTDEDLERRFSMTVAAAHKYGVTAIHDAGLDPVSLRFFKSRAAKGRLPIRVYAMNLFDETREYWGDKMDKILGDGDGTLTARSVKIFADGALRTGGSALYEPYEDNPSTPGFMRIAPETLFDIIPRFLKDGWQTCVHAIGDRANGIVLDAFEAALEGANVTALRPRLEHAQMMAPVDMTRLGKLGVIASVQPTHAISDMWYAQDRLGPERVKRLYAFRSLVDHGARLALGTDAPVEDINPMTTFYASVTRLSPAGDSPHGAEGWFPEQRLSRVEALRGMTIDAAYASFSEKSLGSLERGKLADFVVLNQDIMSVNANELLATNVLATVVEGQAVYGAL
ncbi:amidohydrolase family-domain-containing protein [Schizophyllum amplum]|uniref:Amidohydrolase family-domain-containing protein n=1 Tax=Schizophyllum amplum TaxID=97359 RepID=A0A550CYB7_9AGAR|nr:amidohydrolase family-domain-containing protein [Auriculariopsis ampla]